ncbi:hypothetical protein RchiOBHm_Chr6g0285451 [Rosa chinensis]|uniref:Uncharacterized protein n=1 Tax=Rosa chinensis TaxID=74649 RepID=A0A2P6PUK4_ROSCH|nr:hypothetical protein RchiOBHm_Chr6g0285451 [Rosa chinensis]
MVAEAFAAMAMLTMVLSRAAILVPRLQVRVGLQTSCWAWVVSFGSWAFSHIFIMSFLPFVRKDDKSAFFLF